MADEQYPFGEAGSNDGLNEQGNTSDGAFDAQWYASQEPQASQDTSQAQPTNQMGAHYAQPGTQSSYQGSSYPYQDDAQAYQGTSQTPPQPTQTQPQVWSYGYGQQGAQSSYGYEQQNNWQEPSSSSTYQGTRFSQESVSPSVGAAVATPKSSHVGLKAAITGLVSGVAGALAVTLAVNAFGLTGTAKTTSTATQSSGSGETITINADDDHTIAQAVAAKALPSVVSVYVTSSEGTGLGSGVILDTDGNILTNYHVAGDAEAITVTIGGKSYDATFVGGDSSSDLAVVHAELNGDSVTPIEIGDSDALTVGSWVMTIGSPFGLDQSVSAGIVSSLSRNEMMTSTYGSTLYTNLIQTDASINPGNSGGALVNDQGQLVGISTLFSSDTESFAGIGFAIPGNYAVSVANKIIAGEQVTHAYIGLSMQTVNAQNAEANNLSVNQGAYVAEVFENSPAAEAGIQVGDIVIGLGDEEIVSADGMILAVRGHSIGETVKVTVMRGSEELSFDVTLGSDEELQALQQQLLEEQQQQQQQQQQQWQQQDEGYGNEGYNDIFEELYRYLYENNRGGSYDLSE